MGPYALDHHLRVMCIKFDTRQASPSSITDIHVKKQQGTITREASVGSP